MFGWIADLFVLGAVIKEDVNISVNERMYEEEKEPFKKRKKFLHQEYNNALNGEFSVCFDRKDECRWLQRALFRTIVQEGVLFHTMRSKTCVAKNYDYNYLFVPDYCLWFKRDNDGNVIKDNDGNLILTTELERWKIAKRILESGMIDSKFLGVSSVCNANSEFKKYKWYADADPYVPSDDRPVVIPEKYRFNTQNCDIERKYSDENAYNRTYAIRNELNERIDRPEQYREYGLNMDNVIYNNCIRRDWVEHINIEAIEDINMPNYYFRYLFNGDRVDKPLSNNKKWLRYSIENTNFDYEYGETFRHFPLYPSIYGWKSEYAEKYKESKYFDGCWKYSTSVPRQGFKRFLDRTIEFDFIGKNPIYNKNHQIVEYRGGEYTKVTLW